LAGFQISFERASLGNAFAADQFERIGLARHRDAAAAETSAGSGQVAATAIFRIAPHARAANPGS
jgi:hypothetical protein